MLKSKTKNCCKICKKPVKKSNAIQCQGLCKKWAHFKCLGFTPGKIADLKSGVLKILCPCPDCSTEPKEVVDGRYNNLMNYSECSENSNHCECLQQTRTVEAGTEGTGLDTFMWRKSRFPPFGAPYGFNVQMDDNEMHDPNCQRSMPSRLHSWSMLDVRKPCHHKNHEPSAHQCKMVHSTTTCQTSNYNCQTSSNYKSYSLAQDAGTPGMLDTLEQMCTTVTYLADQIMKIKNKLAAITTISD